jgi:hypothetical protein
VSVQAGQQECEMPTQAIAPILALTCLLSCAFVSNANAQDEREDIRASRQAIISSEQLSRAADLAVQPAATQPDVTSTRRAVTRTRPAATATEPAATATQETLNLSAFKAALSSDVRLTRYDPATRVTEDISDAANTDLGVGEYVAVESEQIQLPPLEDPQGRTYSAFPTMLIKRNADGSISNLRVDDYSDGFIWKKDKASFEASISLAVSDMDNPMSAAPLETPISIKISGQELEGAPYEVEISQLGFEGEQDVIVGSEGRSDPVAVTMRHEIDPLAPKVVDLQLRKPKLTVSANPPAIAGFGIESTEITISSNGVLPADFPLILDSDAGTFDPKEVTIGPTGSTTSRLWSDGTGPVEVRVLDDRFQVSGERVEFLKPVRFLLAIVLGAALGATFIYFWQRARGSASIWVWSAAFVFGIGITVAVFAGFKIPQMLDLPSGRAGLVVPAATSFIAAILINVIYAALSGSATKKE